MSATHQFSVTECVFCGAQFGDSLLMEVHCLCEHTIQHLQAQTGTQQIITHRYKAKRSAPSRPITKLRPCTTPNMEAECKTTGMMSDRRSSLSPCTPTPTGPVTKALPLKSILKRSIPTEHSFPHQQSTVVSKTKSIKINLKCNMKPQGGVGVGEGVTDSSQTHGALAVTPSTHPISEADPVPVPSTTACVTPGFGFGMWTDSNKKYVPPTTITVPSHFLHNQQFSARSILGAAPPTGHLPLPNGHYNSIANCKYQKQCADEHPLCKTERITGVRCVDWSCPREHKHECRLCVAMSK